MLIKSLKGWEIPESQATNEAAFFSRRSLLAMGAGIGAGMIATPSMAQSLYPAKQNVAFKLDRPLSPENVTSKYNNFYEFGSSKEISQAAQALKTNPWTVTLDGLVEKPITIDVDKLIAAMPLEERLMRHRCVEAWSMAVPWTGFTFKSLLSQVTPLASAKYVRFETFQDASVAPGHKQTWYPWPYVEGITIEEAKNDLTMLVTGAYGKPIAKQFGAPLRLILPWKYGFKSIKSIVKITFTDKKPVSFWTKLQENEYGFWANVNPAVPHPRWSQATERMIDTGERVPTQLFNGYGEFVADMYKGLEKEKLWT